MFADFKKAFKKPEFTMSLTEEQMKVFMGEEPDVKCHLVEIKKEHGKVTGCRYSAIRTDGTCDEPKEIKVVG
ncbi:hypothetical protein [Bacillus paranthracis]|uniref:hypothetical protein n=1 Tax=Bacillus paranthracis TaxID=2026186 RepID=UPI000975880D|nr:hypothetical protein [Bacillus paranthracis]MCR6794697.1 hypothetical protein [Bacillus paranthracis]MED1168234.1 hypothetical protein [Bacillus paranthracis]ONG66476.1 hypothetical protein BKK44_21465 [Bacillus cereus]HDR7286611.1 hypothetical protein [Bacillus paranthracis]